MHEKLAESTIIQVYHLSGCHQCNLWKWINYWCCFDDAQVLDGLFRHVFLKVEGKPVLPSRSSIPTGSTGSTERGTSMGDRAWIRWAGLQQRQTPCNRFPYFAFSVEEGNCWSRASHYRTYKLPTSELGHLRSAGKQGEETSLGSQYTLYIRIVRLTQFAMGFGCREQQHQHWQLCVRFPAPYQATVDCAPPPGK
jgi:hypothetical protein